MPASEQRAGAESRQRKNQLILLRKVRNFWGRGVLDQSIRDAALINLARQRCDEDVDLPLRELVGPGMVGPPDGEPTDLLTLLQDSDNALLILGEPGAGKTTTLLQLTEALGRRAEADASQPIPVVLNLVSWAEKRGDIGPWIVEELTAKYQIPRRMGREWLDDDSLALLLDGFDEVPSRFRTGCAREINEFRERHGLATIVVCSRTAPYRECRVPLLLGGATMLCPLTAEQVDAYLEAAGPRLAGLRAAVGQSDNLLAMAESPLMLRVMCAAYAGQSADELLHASPQAPVQIGEAHRHLFEAYVQGMFNRRSQDAIFSPSKTRGWLSWLASQMNTHSQDVFLIEQLQPSWLPSRAWRWVYVFASWLLNGLYGSVIMWFLIRLLGLIVDWPEVAYPYIVVANLVVALVVGALHGLIMERQQRADKEPVWRSRTGRVHMAMLGLLAFVLTTFIFAPLGFGELALAWAMAEAVMLVIIVRYSHGRSFNTEIRTVEALGWSWRPAFKGLVYGLLLAMVSELIESLAFAYNGVTNSIFTFGAAGLILGGLQGTRVQAKNRPNEGIRLSLLNGLLAGALTGGAVFLVTLLASENQERALLTGLMLGLVALFIFGLSNAMKHYLVRVLLWYKRCIPWRLTQLLNHSAHLILMRKVGSGYIYVHRMLQDYFRHSYRARPQIDG